MEARAGGQAGAGSWTEVPALSSLATSLTVIVHEVSTLRHTISLSCKLSYTIPSAWNVLLPLDICLSVTLALGSIHLTLPVSSHTFTLVLGHLMLKDNFLFTHLSTLSDTQYPIHL